MRHVMLFVVALLAAACGSTADTAVAASRAPAVMTLDALYWSDDARLPTGVREFVADDGLCVLGHPVEWQGFEAMKAFTLAADSEFVLEAEGRAPLRAVVATGGIHNTDGSLRFVTLRIRGSLPRDRSAEYTVRPLNAKPGHTWRVDGILAPPQPALES